GLKEADEQFTDHFGTVAGRADCHDLLVESDLQIEAADQQLAGIVGGRHLPEDDRAFEAGYRTGAYFQRLWWRQRRHVEGVDDLHIFHLDVEPLVVPVDEFLYRPG